jgi:sugar/nucleoside kinase (ribokinase family)
VPSGSAANIQFSDKAWAVYPMSASDLAIALNTVQIVEDSIARAEWLVTATWRRRSSSSSDALISAIHVPQKARSEVDITPRPVPSSKKLSAADAEEIRQQLLAFLRS